MSASTSRTNSDSIVPNSRPVTLEEVEVFLNLSKNAMWFADFDPECRQLLWANAQGLKVNQKKDNEELRGVDLVTGTSKKGFEQQDKLYHEVQVEHKRFPQTHMTLYPGGVPTAMSFDAIPVTTHFPWMKDPKVVCLVRVDTIVRREGSEKVQDERNRSNEILSYSQILALLFSEDGGLLQANQRASYFYHIGGQSQGEDDEAPPITMTLGELLDTCVWESDDDKAGTLKEVNGMFRTKKTLELKKMKKQLSKEGKQIWHAITIIACYDPVTGNAAMLVNEADISDLKLVSDELIEAQKARDAFFTSISHELRTPLNGIIGLASSLIDDEATPAASKRQLDVLKGTGQRLAGLVGDILDTREIREGTINLKYERMSLHSAAASALEAMAPLAMKEVELQNKVPADLPHVEGDRDRIVQCLMNLVGNALRFTKWGKIRISGAQVSDSRVALKVSDTGSGITPDRIDTLFFGPENLSKETAKLVGLSGMGLPLVKMLVEGHSGTIDVKSAVGVGTSFKITLPVKQLGAKMRLEQKSASFDSGPAGYRTPERELRRASMVSLDHGWRRVSLVSGNESPSRVQSLAMSAESPRLFEPGSPNFSVMGSAAGSLADLERWNQSRTERSAVMMPSPLATQIPSPPARPPPLPEMRHPRSRSSSHPSSELAHVLLVDSDAMSNLVTERFLDQAGYRTTATASGEEALGALMSDELFPDLVLVSASMPQMDGVEMTRQVREVYSAEDLPIVLMVGSERNAVLGKGIPFGINEILYTPINKVELELRVRMLLRCKEMNQCLMERMSVNNPNSSCDPSRTPSSLVPPSNIPPLNNDGSTVNPQPGGSSLRGWGFPTNHEEITYSQQSSEDAPRLRPVLSAGRMSGTDDGIRDELREALTTSADLRAQMALQQLEASKRERKLNRELASRTEEMERLRSHTAQMELAMQPHAFELQVEKGLVEEALHQLEEKRTAVWNLEARIGASERNAKFGLSVLAQNHRDLYGSERFCDAPPAVEEEEE